MKLASSDSFIESYEFVTAFISENEANTETELIITCGTLLFRQSTIASHIFRVVLLGPRPKNKRATSVPISLVPYTFHLPK
jgi:hypothetical protein